jgi:hypothetical protein
VRSIRGIAHTITRNLNSMGPSPDELPEWASAAL